MRPFFRHAAIVCLLPFAVWAQTAPDIAAGTSPENVIRIYGWPKGRSAAENRESWLYDHFQVIFENGRVLRVVPVARAPASKPVPPVRKQTSPANVGVKPATRIGPPMPGELPYAGTHSTSSPNPLRNPSRPSPPARAEPTPTQTPSIPTPATFHKALWLMFGFLVVVVTARVLMRNRKREWREAEERAAASARREKEAKNRPWQDAVAAALARANGVRAPERSDVAARGELTLQLLRMLEWKRFELIVALYYRATGVRAECTCIGPDGGVDVKLYQLNVERPYSYIQCKAWGSEKVPITKLREFLGVMAADKITEGVYLTTSDYWSDARAFAEANGIAALTATDFIRMFQALPIDVRVSILNEVMTGDYTTPTCPSCDVKAVSRERKRDQVKFWACKRCAWTMGARTPALLAS